MGVSKEMKSRNSGGKRLKLEFVTTLNHQFHLRLGMRPSQTTYGQSNMKTFGEALQRRKIYLRSLLSNQNFLETDHIKTKFVTSSNCSKISEKVSHLLLMCHLQKLSANFYET